ncbi:hypothetical protein AB0B86_24080 [Micromonospora sp. NPDC049047]|uniref:hypothetical protein n=1 Tax=Micromonospora sp. NPDC049047 TaxID=3155645 RepID=UPI0033C6AD3E
MIDLDEQIAQTLREHAEGGVDTDRLLRASRARGRRRQVHRRAAMGTALCLVGALGFVGVTGSDLDELTGRLPWTTATSTPSVVLPRADGVPGAAADPTLVGADPQVLHFGVDPARARYLGWEVIRDHAERVRLSVAGSEEVLIDVSRNVEVFSGSVTVDGTSFDVTESGRPVFDGAIRPASGVAGALVMLWQPVPGLYARAVMLQGNRAVLTKAVEALRWKEARRCAAPLRLGALPEGAKVTGCSVDVDSYPRVVTARFDVVRAPTERMSVEYRYVSQGGTYTNADRTIAGRPALLSGRGTRLELVGIPKTTVLADFAWPAGEGTPMNWPKSFTEADATLVLADVKLSEDPTRSQTWE